MSDSGGWREAVSTGLVIFAVAFAGSVAAFALWLQNLDAPAVTLLGSGDNLSVLITDGPARLLLATGDDPIGLENALANVRPIFARRIDVLLIAGDNRSLLAPVAVYGDRDVRLANALAPLPWSPESEVLASVTPFSGPKRIELGPSLTVTVETADPIGIDVDREFPVWRAIVERGASRIVILSEGAAANLFPPGPPAAIVAVSGRDPASGWDRAPAVAFVANAAEIEGPDLRALLSDRRRPPTWYARMHAGEALRLRFVTGGIAVQSDVVQVLSAADAVASPIAIRPSSTS